MMTSTRSKIGALLVKPALKETLKSFDATEYGGAPLLGLKGLVVKTQETAKAIETNMVFSSVYSLNRRRSTRRSQSVSWRIRKY